MTGNANKIYFSFIICLCTTKFHRLHLVLRTLSFGSTAKALRARGGTRIRHTVGTNQTCRRRTALWQATERIGRSQRVWCCAGEHEEVPPRVTGHGRDGRAPTCDLYQPLMPPRHTHVSPTALPSCIYLLHHIYTHSPTRTRLKKYDHVFLSIVPTRV